MPLKSPFITAHGVETVRHLLIVEASAGGVTGYGEVSALSTPYYTEETHDTARLILESFLIPIALKSEWTTPEKLAKALAQVRRHHMAKAGLEAAAWDLYARIKGQSLSETLGGNRLQVPVGVSIGIERDLNKLCKIVEGYVESGYRRIKLKIVPGWDDAPLYTVRSAFPSLAVMADANASYSLEDFESLRRLDDLDLLMIEQPFSADDLLDHARLQAQMETPICLDESIDTWRDAYQAIELGSCKIINIKPGRVGGMTEAIRIHDLCLMGGVQVWCGGMLESGIGRAHCIGLASLPGFTLPADLSGSARYWEQDIIDPEIEVNNGYIQVSREPGLGYEIREDILEEVTIWSRHFGD